MNRETMKIPVIGIGVPTVVDAATIIHDAVAELLESLEDPKTSPVLKGMIDMAHSLGIRVICEGVESREAEQLLLSLGCDMAQGYLYGYAQPEEDLDAMFEEAGNA